MNPLRSEEIIGVWGTVLLPIREDETIDWFLLDKEIETLLDAGLHGVYTNGTAGEFYNQTEAEFDTLSEKLATAAEKRGIPFQLGCAHPSPLVCLDRVRRASSLQPGALQIILPDWIPPRQSELISYVEKIAKVSDPVGLVLYNPPHAKRRLSPEDYQEILQEGLPVLGCKTAGGDDDWFEKMRRLPPSFSSFIPGHRMASGMSRGGKGSYSNIACLHPGLAVAWYRLFLENSDQAMEWEKRLLDFFQTEIFPLIQKEAYSDTAVDKFLAAIGGWTEVGTRLRWPYQGVPEELAWEKRKQLEGIFPEFFSSK
jgi:dihydrodipicolinate synthase/N-acetylneuraminate lyase